MESGGDGTGNITVAIVENWAGVGANSKPFIV